MDIIHNLRNYILETDFELKFYKNKVNIVNFTSIGHFDSHKVIVKYTDEAVAIVIKQAELMSANIL